MERTATSQQNFPTSFWTLSRQRCAYSFLPSLRSCFATWRSFSSWISIFFWYCFSLSRCCFSCYKPETWMFTSTFAWMTSRQGSAAGGLQRIQGCMSVSVDATLPCGGGGAMTTTKYLATWLILVVWLAWQQHSTTGTWHNFFFCSWRKWNWLKSSLNLPKLPCPAL